MSGRGKGGKVSSHLPSPHAFLYVLTTIVVV